MSEFLGLEFEQMLVQARAGDCAARGRLLSHYTNYLNLLARLNLGRGLQAKLNHSDIVQDAFLEADKNFDGYRGTTEQELMAWLRQILAMQIAQEVRFHHRQRRDVALERRLAEDIDRSSAGLGVQLIDTGTSPSLQAARREREVLLANALAKLTPEHREVIILRNLDELSFDEVAERMGRTTPAVKSLWVRALANLRRVLGKPS